MGLTIKPLKCQLAMPECTYLEYGVGKGVVKPIANKVEAFFLPRCTRCRNGSSFEPARQIGP